MGSLPRAGGRVGVPGAAGAKKIVRLASVFPSPPFGLPTSQGRGGLGCMDSTLALGAFRIARDAGGEAVREREPRRAGEGRLSLESKLLLPHRLSVIAKMFSWPVGSKDEGAAPEIDSQIDPDITPDISPTHDP